MSQLKKARNEINAIDRQIAELFCRRMKAVAEIADYKKEHGLPIFDPARENDVLMQNSERVEDTELRGYYVKFLAETMKISREYQRKRLEGMRVAFCGVEGAFAHIAAKRIFPTAEMVSFPDFKAAYDSVVSGDCDAGVLPIENSTAGEVGAVMDMMFSGSLFLSGVYDLTVEQHLMACPGTKLSDIREVVSHPQALTQCAEYLRLHPWQRRQYENTAMAAKMVAEGKDKSLAAIASMETAELYGLEILEKNINHSHQNTTRFAVLTRSTHTEIKADQCHSMLMFTVKNEAGSLAKAIEIIGRYGYNMRCLRSRPMKELLWQYYFYVEAEGNFYTEAGKQMVEALHSCCDRLKVFGCFSYPAELH